LPADHPDRPFIAEGLATAGRDLSDSLTTNLGESRKGLKEIVALNGRQVTLGRKLVQHLAAHNRQ